MTRKEIIKQLKTIRTNKNAFSLSYDDVADWHLEQIAHIVEPLIDIPCGYINDADMADKLMIRIDEVKKRAGVE